MRTTISYLALLGLFATPARAQPAPDRDAILAAVTRYFDGMRARDTAVMGSVTHPGATMAAVRYANNTAAVSRGLATATNQRIASGSGPGPNEWLLSAEVWQGGEVASVWAPYEIHADGQLMHCGYDAFNLVRDGGRWRIAGTIYTARPGACPAVRSIAKRPHPLPEPNPEERDAVMQAVNAFVRSLRTRDTALLVSLFSPGAQWVTAGYGDQGITIRRRPATADVQMLTRSTETLDEQLYDIVVRIDGDIALVWAPYRFLIGGRLSHCGHDAFHLIREQGTWHLEGGVYTTRPDGC